MATQGPLVLNIDDLHTASADGIDALGVALAKIHGPALVLLYGRPELTRSSGVLTRISEAEVHPLPPLTGADAARGVREFLGGGRMPKPDEDRLLGFAQGNPYYLAELVTLLTEQGLLSGEGDTWRLAAGSLTGRVLSRDLAQVLGARIHALSPAARALLRAASIFGDAVPPEAAQLLEKEVPGEFERALQELLDRRMLRRRSYGGYRFVTPLLRQAWPYAPIWKADAAHAHAEIARWAADTELEGQSADDLVVYHAEQAVTLAKEVEIEKLDEVWNVLPLAVEAVRKQAARAMDASEPERAVARSTASNAWRIGFDDRLLRGRAPTARAAPKRPKPEIEGLAVDIAASPRRQSLSTGSTRSTVRAPLRGRLPQDEAELVAQLPLLRGRLHRYKGELQDAGTAWTAALALSRREGLAGPRCDAQCRIGLLDFLAGHLSEAEARFLDAYDTAFGVGDDKRLAWALQHRAWVLVARGDFDGADDVLREAAKAFARQMDLVGRAWVRGVSAFALLMAGRFTEAKRLSDVFMPIGERSGDVFAVGLLRAIGAAAQVGPRPPGGRGRRSPQVLPRLRAHRRRLGPRLRQVRAGPRGPLDRRARPRPRPRRRRRGVRRQDRPPAPDLFGAQPQRPCALELGRPRGRRGRRGRGAGARHRRRARTGPRGQHRAPGRRARRQGRPRRSPANARTPCGASRRAGAGPCAPRHRGPLRPPPRRGRSGRSGPQVGPDHAEVLRRGPGVHRLGRGYLESAKVS